MYERKREKFVVFKVIKLIIFHDFTKDGKIIKKYRENQMKLRNRKEINRLCLMVKNKERTSLL